jgi:sugar O-acyltransferase (sialic acid O-acetyltransferase NeuD family)
MKLLIAGAGGHGRVVADAALATQAYSSLAFLDDRPSKTVTVEGWPIIGSLDRLEELNADFGHFVAGLGDAAMRIDLLRRARRARFRCASIIHPTATVSRHCFIDEGTVVMAGACINVGARISAGCIINTGATVDHDCLLSEGVHICPGAHLAGNVEIGPRAWFGIGAVARQGIRIGANAVIGAGAVVIRDVPDNVTIAGNPARELERRDASTPAQGSHEAQS